jgi:hypothetical protein
LKTKVAYFLFLSLLISTAISCSINTGSNGTYSVTLYNHHCSHTIALIKNSHCLVKVAPGGTYTSSSFVSTDFVRIYNQIAEMYFHDVPLVESWTIDTRFMFDYYGGGVINATVN